ncbi:hypothetical protein [Polaromonas sp. JS666]|uniref:hypothetical protein n=1 Tax=Polaromonas sp. (strain JS666 / ATCC BAA-500) TaxID=296591 RepID=UPI0011136E45|nr:hypothetical protein [Polaromonas sp. JS666]
MIIGWGVVIGLSFLELMASLYGRPSVLVPYPEITAFVAAVGQWVPMVQSFARCAAGLDTGSGLMLALDAVFFPIKLVALYYAHPRQLLQLVRGWRAVWGAFYVFLFAAVALVPTYIWGWLFAPGDAGLASINRKTSALCAGGGAAFFAALIQGGFALSCAYFSVVILRSVFDSLVRVFTIHER